MTTKRTKVPKVKDNDVLGWFERMAFENGDHPLTLASSGKVLKDAGLSPKKLTAALLRKAVKSTLGPAKAHAARHNVAKLPGVITVNDVDWLTFATRREEEARV